MDVSAEDAQKLAYAAILLREPDPFKAAFELFPSNTNRAIFVAANWVSDVVVLDEQARLKEVASKTTDALPTKDELSREIWKRMKAAPEDKDFVALAKLYGEVNSMIEKPQAPTATINVQQNRVMTVREFGAEENWEAKMLEQQRNLARGKFN